mmetsp:Transcript_19924/g.29014  ORF Transcript_19924/g.29014 Transcript_19924/m.29014 type:complete len:238 (-) Transcript_19924:236-949(-)|eukprot:CAMPEP_0184744272 /NCGR_PEP_ID=MMETSP0315-20130426/7096_1 /TAXON_ID=101924 /ORGANISM="Rhodosorus marinus, Strain UTEX LB 2760" /LENGTH=237 /DNA_ID=CAMNT_0027215955 /DNA_START=52 /DNA_END=765 /DNA_ORIENTATION=-
METGFVVSAGSGRQVGRGKAFCGVRSSFLGRSVAGTEWRRLRRAKISMLTSNDFRVGTTIELDGQVHKVLEFLHVKPGKGSAFVRTKLKNLQSGNNVDKTFRAGESVIQALLEKSTMQHTYLDGNEFVFMNMETFEEERLPTSALGDQAKFMKEGLDVDVLRYQGKVLDVELPKQMVLEVTMTDPGVKGNTVQGGTKPATLETGAVVQVPLFIKQGEKIRVDVREAKYISRAGKDDE